MRSKVEVLAATYLIEASTADLHESGGSPTLSWSNPKSRLIFEAEPPTRVIATECSLGSIRIQAVAAIDPAEKTHRFKYRWRWSNSPGIQIWDNIA